MGRFTRKRLLAYGLAGGSALAFTSTRPAAARVAEPCDRLPRFREPLPVPGAGIVVARPAAAGRYALRQRQIRRRLHPHLPPTPIWAYDDGSGLAGQEGSFGIIVLPSMARRCASVSRTTCRGGIPGGCRWTRALPLLVIRCA
jgi:hypothetical protein